MDIGPPELLIILAVVLVLFGGKKLPELARSLGKAKKEFQEGLDDKGVEHHAQVVATSTAPAPAPAELPQPAAAPTPAPPVDDTGTVAAPSAAPATPTTES